MAAADWHALVHTGDLDTDDRDRATAILAAAARQAEPAISPVIQRVAAATGGTVARFDTLFKTSGSIADKLDRYGKPTSPVYRLKRFNDALRYTIVYADAAYATAMAAARAELREAGCTPIIWPQCWFSAGYKGCNATVADPQGYCFEVQFHTAASLATAELTHPMYERERSLPRHHHAQVEISRRQDHLWARVPVPPGIQLAPRRG
jgi:hypothetical protein